MDSRKRELVERLTRVADHMSAHMRGAGAQDWGEFDLTMPQLRALVLLNQAPLRMSDIAAYLGSSLPATTSLVERLEGKGLVERLHDPVDRRVVMCHPTAAGRAEVERFWQVHHSKLEAVAEILTYEELTKVVEAMETLSAALERHARSQGRAAGPGTDSLALRGR